MNMPLLTSTIRPEPRIGREHRLHGETINTGVIPEITTRTRRTENFILYFEVMVRVSQSPFRKKSGNFPYNGRDNIEDIESAVRRFLEEEKGYASTGEQIDLSDLRYTLTRRGQIPTLQIIQNTMREHKPISVFNLYTNIINLDSEPGMCVPDALTKKFPKIAKLKKNNPIPAMKEANTEKVMEFCKKYGIRAIAYDIHKNVIAENIPEKDDKKYASLIYLYYANHMYLLDNKYLAEKPTPEKTVLQDETTLQNNFKALLNQHILPGNIHASGGIVVSFSHDDTIYFTNDDYDKVQQIGKKFMFSDKMPYHIRLPYVFSILEKLYSSANINSFMPINHTKPAFFYNIEPKSDDHQTIDKNKAYSYILKNLPYLLSTDMRTYDCIKTNEYDDEYALYVAESTPNILMPRRDIYTGQHIKYCKDKIQFTIHEKLTCKKHANHFTSLIHDLFLHLDHSIAKQVVVQAIGTFQSEPKRKTVWNVVSKDDRNPHNFSFECENMFLEESKSDKVSSIYNRKPIAIQVKDRMSQMLFDKMMELKLSDSDIIQINTDSITFYNKPLHLILNKDDFNGWKQGEYKQKQGSIYDTSTPFDTFFQRIQNDNTLITGPAGNGKSYHIQNKMDLTDAIILSSKHSAIRQHREKGLNAHVIQKFCGVSEVTKITIPKENHIIVEECGILTRQHWDFLFKCVLLNKKLTILGDFDQLLPVDESKPYNQPAFLNMIFNNQQTKNENWRNDFTLEYYKSLLSGNKEYLEQELKKYSTKNPEDADVIIAYRGSDDAKINVVKKYNDYMLAYHNQTITDDDVPVMCITNDLRKHDMYNNFLFKSQEIPVDLLENEKYFRVAYARTLYNLQGDETKSFYVAPEDMKWFLNPRMAYTLISRLSKRSE